LPKQEELNKELPNPPSFKKVSLIQKNSDVNIGKHCKFSVIIFLQKNGTMNFKSQNMRIYS